MYICIQLDVCVKYNLIYSQNSLHLPSDIPFIYPLSISFPLHFLIIYLISH